MAETTNITQVNDLAAQVAAMLAQQQKFQEEDLSQYKAQGGGWSKPKPTVNIGQPEKVLIPVELDTPKGKCTVYLQYDGQCAATPEALMTTLETLDAQGVPLKTWAAKSKWGGNGNGGWRR